MQNNFLKTKKYYLCGGEMPTFAEATVGEHFIKCVYNFRRNGRAVECGGLENR
jgi:hypothetical protein